MKRRSTRILSFLLALAMIVTVLPAVTLATDGEHYLAFASDRHSDSTAIGTAMSGFPEEADVEYVCLIGDMASDTRYNTSMVKSEVTALYPSAEVDIIYASHDQYANDDATILNCKSQGSSGLIYTGQDNAYYVYGIAYNDMNVSSPDTTGFTNWIATIGQDVPVFIVSHMPLHRRRGDNYGAAVWLSAINAAAETHEIVFFWGHNHTGENETDWSVFLVEKGGRITPQGGNETTINFAYMNAGYLNANAATLVKIEKDKVELQKYNSGSANNTYKATLTLASAPEEETVTLESISVRAKDPAKTYTAGDLFSEQDIAVTAHYSDDTDKEVNGFTFEAPDMDTAGEKTVTVSYIENGVTQTATYQINVNAREPETRSQSASYQRTTTEIKEAFVLASSISANKEYLIVNTNRAGDGYALGNGSSSNSVDFVAVRVLQQEGNSGTLYILPDNTTNIVWKASGSSNIKFTNNSEYLRRNNSNILSISSTDTNNTWSLSGSANRLTYSVVSGSRKTTYYLGYNNSSKWNISTTSSTVYVYEKTELEIPTTVSVDGEFSLNADDIKKIVVANSTQAIASKIMFKENGTDTLREESNSEIGGSFAYQKTKDYNEIIQSISADGIITFTGNYGEAKVKVAYTFTVDNIAYTIWDTITVTAEAPSYAIEITDGTDTITETVTVKGVTPNQTMALGYAVSYEDDEGTHLVSVSDSSRITWDTSDASIAAVNAIGTVTFTGSEGQVNITVAYEVNPGESVTDTVTFSVSKSTAVVPADGTDDFPIYPTQGSIRYDKAAVAVGNFSETGIAQVELSMTGVPYGSSKQIDVIVMVDMTTSMGSSNNNLVDDTITATKGLIDTLCTTTDDGVVKYNDNINLEIWTFRSSSAKDYSTSTADDSHILVTNPLTRTTIASSTELYAAKAKISKTTFDTTSNYNGTSYAAALKCVNDRITALKSNGNAKYVIFLTDGAPTVYQYGENEDNYQEKTGSTGIAADTAVQKWFTTAGTATDAFKGEYQTRLLKEAGVKVFTIGMGLSVGSTTQYSTTNTACYLINHMSSNYREDGETAKETTDTTNYCYYTGSAGTTYLSDLQKAFGSITSSIKEAATDVTVTDKIAEEYTLILQKPAGDVDISSELPAGQEFYIEVVRYELDENHERKSSPATLERVTLSDSDKVTFADGKITAIRANTFTYDADTRILTWKAEKLDETELAIRYFVYLNDSAADKPADQTEAGPYPTNDYAYLDYTNFNGNKCHQVFPIPQLTWNGAQVSYVFYLVNDDGKPVNQAGKVVDFANACFVTDVFTYAVTWNDTTGVSSLSAEYLASAVVPEGYHVYDPAAKHDIKVYETELGAASQFTISGSDTGITDKNTTIVYNTKAGKKVTGYGTYTRATSELNLSSTTVAFAVKWERALNPDTVVVDFGLPVNIDVCANDLTDNNAVHAINNGAGGYSNYQMNSGITANAQFNKTELNLTYGKATVNGSSITYTPTGMSFSGAEEFYYDTAVHYYEDSTKKTGYLYSSVTVIPATTIYYEDGFVTYTDGDAAWENAGTAQNAAQASDRPGASQISASIDADNLYGYDAAYLNCGTYSNGSARKVTVASGAKPWPTATFTFTGTGFDLISLTDNTTGAIKVQVYKGNSASDTAVKNWVVDTYYGYTCEKDNENPYLKYVWTYGDDAKWHLTEKTPVTTQDAGGLAIEKPANPQSGARFVTFEDNYNWVVTEGNNALYQIPVIKGTGFDYGTYTVVITPTYSKLFDDAGKGSYSFYLDAVRIYDPAQNDSTSKEAYALDGEAYPEYIELRTHLLDAQDLDASRNSTGIVFVDGIADATITDYANYGPNHEVYLKSGQSVAFKLNNDHAPDIAKTELAFKAPAGEAKVQVTAIDGKSAEYTVKSATDLYYDISAIAEYEGSETAVIVITNTGSNLISLTNLKTTYTKEPAYTQMTNFAPVTYTAAVTEYLTASYLAKVPAEAAEEEPATEEPEIFEPETFTVKLSKTSAKVGDKITVTVTASADVEAVSVNGTSAVKGRNDKRTGLTTWTVTFKATEAGDFTVGAVAVNAEGLQSEALLSYVSVTEKKTSGLISAVKSIAALLGL